MRPGHSAALVVAWLAVSALAGCSALGLGDYELVDCDPDPAVCDALSDNLPDDACMRYACSESGYGCVVEPLDADGDGFASPEVCAGEVEDARLDCDDGTEKRNHAQAERCDGIDNDCDTFIDEGASDLQEEVEPRPVDTRFKRAAYAVAPDGTLHLALTAEASPGYATSHLTLVETFGDLEPLLRGQQCESGGSFIDCQISELALAATGDVIVGAGVHSFGCGAGQLRVGAGQIAAFDLTLGGLDASGLAVDLDPDSEQACTRSSPTCEGALSPAAAVLDSVDMPPEALFVWLAPSADAAADCDGATSFHVAALALPVEVSADGARLSAEGYPDSEPLNEGAIGAPVVVASSSPGARGFFVAYPSMDGVAVLFVPYRDGRARIGELVETTIEAEDAEAIALTASESGRGLAVAYVANDGGGRSLELVVLDPQGEGRLDELALSERIALTVQGNITAGPTLAFAPSGFMDTAASAEHGGWLVTWVEGDGGGSNRLMAARIAERGAYVLNERIQLADGEVREPFTYLKHDRDNRIALRAGHITDDAIHARTVSCDIDN